MKSKITNEQLIAEIASGLTLKAIADKYEMNVRTVETRSSKLSKQGLGHGRDVSSVVADGYKVKGTSTMLDADGNVKLQWVKTDIDAEKQLEILENAKKELLTGLPVYENVKIANPFERDSNLVNLYTITDLHIGCLADADEGGDDYNIKIAAKLASDWFASATVMAPNAKKCIINFQGDMMHFDGLKAVTPTSGHILDADSRFFKVVRTAIQVIKTAVKLCLEKHDEVELLVAEGNHDLASSVWLREMFAEVFSENDRINVNREASPYYAYEFGDTMLAIHHGHCANFARVESAVIAKYREMFGRTKFSYIHLGHYHHRRVMESNTFIVEQHQTLAAKDEYSSKGGYNAGRSANVITYHKRYGEVGRISIPVEMLRDLHGE